MQFAIAARRQYGRKLPVMTILFQATGAGNMDTSRDCSPYSLPIVLIILGAIVLNVIVIALVVQFIKQHFEGDYEEGGMDHVCLWSNHIWPRFYPFWLPVGMLTFRKISSSFDNASF